MPPECAAMEKKVSSTGFVDSAPTVQEAGAKEAYRALRENFYWPQRICQMPTLDETVKTSGDRYTIMVPRYGVGSND